MNLILGLLGVVLLVVAAVYFLVPAGSTAGLFPGHEAGVARMHYQARHRARPSPAWCCWPPAFLDGTTVSDEAISGRGIRRHDADVAPGDEPCASPHPECPPPRRPHRLHLGRAVLDLARDRSPGLGAGGGALPRAASPGATASSCIPRIATRCSGRCSRRSGWARSGCRPISG